MKHGYLALSNCDSYVDIIININGLLRYPYKPRWKLHKVDYKLEVCVVLMQGSLTYTQSTAYLHIEIFKK